MANKTRHVAWPATAPLRLVHGVGAPAKARTQPEIGLTLLARQKRISTATLRAHALKSCLERIGAVHRRAFEKASRVPPGIERAAAALERARTLVESALSEPATELAEAWSHCAAEEVMTLAIERVRDRADDRKIELWVRTDRGGLEGDRDLLVDALESVIVNALDASAPCARVFVTAFELAGGDQYWTVDDNGCGMSSEMLGRLGTRGAIAVGGLGVARAIVEAHGGLVHVSSELGIGTRVGFWLPRSA